MGKKYNILRGANLALIFITFVAYLSPYISPVSFWAISLFGLAYPWLLLLHLLLIATWIVFKRWYFLFSLACILLGWSHFSALVGLHPFAGKAQKEEIKVLTYNINSFLFFGTSDSTAQKNLWAFIKKTDADVLCFQEFRTKSKRGRTFMDFLKRQGYRHQRESKLGHLLICSKAPFEKSEEINFENTTNGVIYTDIKLKGKTTRVFNLHLESNKITNQANQIAEDADLQQKETWYTMGNIFQKIHRASEARAHQAEVIAAAIQSAKMPVLLCGDFNDTPLSYTYARLSDDMCDSWRESGFGLGVTFGGSIPGLRIDYILGTADLDFKTCRILKEPFSDHYPVLASFDW